MSASCALIALGTIIAVIIVVAVWQYRKTTKLWISDLRVGANGAVWVGVNSANDPSNLVGKRLALSTKALGRIYTSVCSASVAPWQQGGMVTQPIAILVSPAGAYTGPAPNGAAPPYGVTIDPNDYAVIMPMW